VCTIANLKAIVALIYICDQTYEIHTMNFGAISGTNLLCYVVQKHIAGHEKLNSLCFNLLCLWIRICEVIILLIFQISDLLLMRICSYKRLVTTHKNYMASHSEGHSRHLHRSENHKHYSAKQSSNCLLYVSRIFVFIYVDKNQIPFCIHRCRLCFKS
jgi:hypothetical protein